VRTDDLLKRYPDLAPWRPAIGLQPRLTDAELVPLAVMQALLGYTSEARWIRHARAHLGHLFPCLPGQPGYNRRLRAAAALITTLIRLLAADTSLWTDDVWVVDSTPVECGRSKDTTKRSDLAGWAEYGYCASHSRYFWGLRLHLVATLGGLPIAFALTSAKADERQTLLSILDADPTLAATRPGQTLIADRHYYCTGGGAIHASASRSARSSWAKIAAPALVVLQPGRGDRLAPQHMDQVRGEPVILQQFHQPAGPVRGLQRRRSARRQAADHLQDRLHPIGHIAVGKHLPGLVHHRHLRALAVHIDPDVNRHRRPPLRARMSPGASRYRAEQEKGVRPHARPS